MHPILFSNNVLATHAQLPHEEVSTTTLSIDLFFFFFQAEDGIRDHCVTGVQTCALPISAGAAAATFKALDQAERVEVLTKALEKFDGIAKDVAQNTFTGASTTLANQWDQIGRASCRERV